MKLVNKPTSYTYTSFPPITSNGTMGGNTFACEGENENHNLYKMFYYFPIPSSQGISRIGSWASWYHPNPVNYTKLIIENNVPNNYITGKIQASNDNGSWIDIANYLVDAVNNEINLSYIGYYHYYRITFESYPSSATISFGNPVGTCLIPNKTSILKSTRKYYKYSISSWTQPVLTSDGLIGGYSMAVASSRAPYSTNDVYRAFDSDTSTRWYPAGTGSTGIPIILTIYTPENINITNLQFMNAANANNAPNAFTVYGSNDNTSFTQLGSFTNSVQTSNATWNVDLSSNTGYYQYYKIEFTQWNGAATGGRGIKEIDITATQKTITEGTSSDYDFYEDVNAYMAVV